MENFNNDEVKKMLEMLKEKAENTKTEEHPDAQTADNASHSDDDIKDMLKKHFSADETEAAPEISDDYSFDTEDFSRTGEISAPEIEEPEIEETIEEEIEEVEEVAEEIVEESQTEEIFEDVEEIEDTIENAVEEIVEETIDETIEEVVEETIDETINETIEETIEPEEEVVFSPPERTEQIEIITESNQDVERAVEEVRAETDELVAQTVQEIEDDAFDQRTRAFGVSDEAIPDATRAFASFETAAFDSVNQDYTYQKNDEKVENNSTQEENDGPLSEESINYDEVLEGQQGTVFNRFVEDFTGDLDDVVFEAEITASHAPVKQYTIFEDWEQLMKDQQYNTAEEGIIPPTAEELAYSAEIAARTAQGNTDYFTPVVVEEEELDAVDIALMVALGGEDELDQTVGFEKIRQAVDDDNTNDVHLENKDIYGYCGEEYSSLAQNLKIKKKYKNDKIKLFIKAGLTALITLVLLCYEIAGWAGVRFGGIFNADNHPDVYVLFGLQLLFIAIAISGSKFKKLFKGMLEFSSLSYIGAIIISALSVFHDIFILTLGYTDPSAIVHSLAALLLLVSCCYDLFDVYQQSGVFEIISKSNKKLVLEPYGKLRMSEDDAGDDVIDKDSYCISRVSSTQNFFARTARTNYSITGKLISLVLSLSVAFCVMIVLLLFKEEIGTIMFSLIVTLSFSLIIASIFESEFAFFAVYKILKKYRTGIIGKSSVAEYGKCNIVYFDDFNVFNKKSVRTKGLKLYDNNEIYRILYHTQAVFSKVGGPLKGVFEYATTEMAHSKNVEIKEISKEGIYAMVDSRTSVLIGTGSFMKLRGIHPTYTAADLKLEKEGTDSIMFIALNGTLGAKLYVTYQFSSEFERLAKKLSAHGINIGIRSADPNVNDTWAKKYGDTKKCSVSTVRPNVSELKPSEKSLECGIVSTKNVRALAEALIMCSRLDAYDSFISKIRAAAIVLVGILTFALMLFNITNAVSMLLLMLACALGTSIMMLLTHYYIKK